MSTKPQDRPTFKVAHWYRCRGLCERQTFLEFQDTFTQIVENLDKTKDDDTEFWKYVRSLFDFDDYADCVPINAANLSILFYPVVKFTNALAMDWTHDISIQKREEPFVWTIGAARALVAKELNVDPSLLAFQRNGSDPNAAINFGLTFLQGEEVILWNENHPTQGEVGWKIRKDRFPHIHIKVVDLQGETDSDKIVAKFVDAVTEKTRIVAFSEVSKFFFHLFISVLFILVGFILI